MRFIDTPGFSQHQREFIASNSRNVDIKFYVLPVVSFLIAAATSALLFTHATHPRIQGFVRDGGTAWLMNFLNAGVVTTVALRTVIGLNAILCSWMFRDYNNDTRQTQKLHLMILQILPGYRESVTDRILQSIFLAGLWIFLGSLIADGWFSTAGFFLFVFWASRRGIIDFTNEVAVHIKRLTPEDIVHLAPPIDVECRTLAIGESVNNNPPIIVQGKNYHRVN